MLKTSQPRERLGLIFAQATRLSFAALLFVSPSMLYWTQVSRPLNSVYSGYTDFFVYVSDLFLALTVIVGLLGPLVSGRGWKRGPWYLTFPLAALVILSFLSALGGVDPLLTVYTSFRFLLLFGLYLAIVNTPLSPGWVAIPLGLAILVQSTVAILQFAHQASLGLYFLGEQHLNPLATGVSILRYDDVRVLRAYGLTDHPNLLGGFLAFALIFVLGYYLATGGETRSSTYQSLRYLCLVPLTLGVLALFFTFSRAAELGFVVGAAFVAFAGLRDPIRRRARVRDLGFLGLILAAVLILPALSNRRLLAQRIGQDDSFTENVGEVRSLVERDELAASANRLFYERQWLGVGNGALTLAMYYLDKDFPKDKFDYQPAHLVVLDAATELGLLGGFLWLSILLAPLIVMWVRRNDVVANPWMAAVAAGLIVILLAGFFDYYPWLWQSGRIWQWSALGLFAAVFAGRNEAQVSR